MTADDSVRAMPLEVQTIAVQSEVPSTACALCGVVGRCDCGLEIGPLVNVETHLSTLFGRDSVYVLLFALQTGLAAVVTPVATRLLGSDAYGEMIAAIAVMQALSVVAGLGLGAAVSRAYFEKRGPTKARRLVTVTISFAVLITAVADVTGRFWATAIGFNGYGGAVRLAVFWAGVSAVTGCALRLLKTQDRIVAFAIGSLIQSALAEVVSIGFVLGIGHTARNYILGELVAQIAATIFVLAYIRPKGFARRHRALISRALRYSLPLVPAGLSTLALYSADRLILQAQIGESEVARYQIAYNIASIPLVLLMVLNSMWMPRFYALADEAEVGVLLGAARDALYRLLVPVILGVMCGGPLVLKVWVPSSYRPERLQVLMFVILLTCLPFAAGQSGLRALMTTGGTTTIAVVTAIAGAVNIGLNFPLIAEFGLIGAAFATFVSYVVLQVLLNLSARRRIRIPRIARRQVIELGVLALAGWAIALVPESTAILVVRSVCTVGAVGWFAVASRKVARPGSLTSAKS